MNTKTTSAAVTLVAVVPALALAFFLVKTFLTQLGQLRTPFISLYAVTLAACAVIIFLPFGVLIFGPKSKAKAEKAPKADQDDAAPEPPKTDEYADGAGTLVEQPFGDEPFEPPYKGEHDDAENLSGDMAAAVFDDAPPATSDIEIVEGAMLDDFDGEEAPASDGGVAAIDDEEFLFDDEMEDERPPGKKRK